MARLITYSSQNPDIIFYGLSEDTLVLPIVPGLTQIDIGGFCVHQGGVGIYPFLGSVKNVSSEG
jgi:hypothetical protein